MNASLVIFDCDGVLVDSEVVVCRVQAQVLRAAGFEVTAASLMRDYVGLNDAEMRSRLAMDHGRELALDVALELDDAVRGALEREVRPVSGMSDLLKELPVDRCVASNSGARRVQTSLVAAGLDVHFSQSSVFSAEMVARPKPAPDLFVHAARVMGAEPMDCVVVEDSVTGVIAGVAAGMRVIGFLGASHAGHAQAARLADAGAALVVSSARELQHVLT